MEDKNIVALYLERNELAISTTSQKYGRYCEAISYNLLGNHEEAEQCINDALLDVWNSIPPNKPSNLRVYIGKIVRNKSLNIRQDSIPGNGINQLWVRALHNCVCIRIGEKRFFIVMIVIDPDLIEPFPFVKGFNKGGSEVDLLTEHFIIRITEIQFSDQNLFFPYQT